MASDIFRNPASLADVALTALSSHEWRVSNRRVDPSDPAGLIGFIEQTGGEYEVLRLGAPLERSHYPSLADARAAFVDAAHVTMVSRAA